MTEFVFTREIPADLFACEHKIVGTDPKEVLAPNEGRLSALIQHVSQGGANVWIDGKQSAAGASGLLLVYPGALRVTSQGRVYAVAESGTVRLAIAEESLGR